ncbi:hypothetical protein BDN72DRAFT_793755 [Pluteus cervinus]|uniref:Uncharacterized protein n=1 Tax=Pluteus cervinus TaxID=181527 RepID=A0ACD3B1S6_9AGAR|nr:hypothetical protein BDN72DRAFT_793755 [Pluteus cervinus]
MPGYQPQTLTQHKPRSRPPNITLGRAGDKRGPVASIELEAESPLNLSDDDVFEDTLQLSSSDSDSPSPSPTAPALSLSSDDDSTHDDLSRDLQALEMLRKSVRQNLRLRPIRSRTDLPKVTLVDGIPSSPFPQPSPSAWPSSASSTKSSYYTPLGTTPLSSTRSFASSVFESFPRSAGSSLAAQSPAAAALLSVPILPRPSRPIAPGSLYQRLTGPIRPLLIDTRPAAAHLSYHVRFSINIAIPSLILKRCRKPGGGFPNLESLRQFITTEQGKDAWDILMRSAGPWDGDVVIYDDEMDPKDRDNVGVTAWALLPVLAPLLSFGSVDYLEGGLSAAGHHPDLETLIVSGGDEEDAEDAIHRPPQPTIQAPQTPGKKGRGLFQLDTQSAFRSKALPEVEQASASPLSANVPAPNSPMPMMPAAIPPPRSNGQHRPNELSPPNLTDPSPSPPPSQVGFRRPPPPRNSVPNLRKLETTSAERLNATLPKLSLRTLPIKSQTLNVPAGNHHHPPSLTLQAPASPSHLVLAYSSHSPPVSARWNVTTHSTSSPSSSSPNAQLEFLSAYYTPPHTPGTPKPVFPPSPQTARPDLDAPLTTEEAMPAFTISTILPNFLYLGPELTLPEHVKELKSLGVRRILNIAIECDDDQGLLLREVFERYVKIPMRDNVEEEGIARGVREVCDILDDARLHSAPTYVHCKAGKSRSVTAVMAYLIHANHWTLSRAYAFVLERRKGISPNIGFVSELMTFEEEELGGKSIGVQPTSSAGGSGDHDGHHYAAAVGGGRRNAHVRESLPPTFVGGDGSLSADARLDVKETLGQEMEIKDATGRYRHARRAPVDETTLQPSRRVSKAGLESSGSWVD